MLTNDSIRDICSVFGNEINNVYICSGILRLKSFIRYSLLHLLWALPTQQKVNTYGVNSFLF